MRRWYSVSSHHCVPRDKLDPSWESALDDPYWYDVLRRSGHRGRDDFNYIEVEPADDSSSYSQHPLRPYTPISYHKPPASSDLPHVLYTDLQNRQYLEFVVETCTWRGERFVFKQILADPHVQLDSEISMINPLLHSPYIVHIEAYIMDEDDDMRGILLPWAGECIDKVPTVRWSYFRDVTYGLRYIHALTNPDGQDEASHGDVFCRNILVQDGVAHIIDLDNAGCDYPGDRIAFADVIAELKEKAEGKSDTERMEKLGCLLHEGVSFDNIAAKISDW